jgi:hypothetical protein
MASDQAQDEVTAGTDAPQSMEITLVGPIKSEELHEIPVGRRPSSRHAAILAPAARARMAIGLLILPSAV